MGSDEEDVGNVETSKTLDGSWSIRPCFLYKEEYDDCTSFKARFHQYFINGKNTDCSQWKKDYENCQLYEKSNGNDLIAGKKLIESEKNRRIERLRAHYDNNTWKKRSEPPADWNKPLPDWLEEKNQNTFLEIKAKEMAGLIPTEPAEKSYCSIM